MKYDFSVKHYRSQGFSSEVATEKRNDNKKLAVQFSKKENFLF
jgi:hypothetical protein